MDLGAKVYENRLRRVAARQGLVLQRSRRRDPRAVDFGKYRFSNEEEWQNLTDIARRLGEEA